LADFGPGPKISPEAGTPSRRGTSPALRRLSGKTVMTENGNDKATLNYMFSAAYEELRRLAASVRRDDPGATLNPTALVTEAWIKLASSSGIEPARRRKAEKRGGGLAAITLDESMEPTPTSDHDLLALDEALEELGRIEP